MKRREMDRLLNAYAPDDCDDIYVLVDWECRELDVEDAEEFGTQFGGAVIVQHFGHSETQRKRWERYGLIGYLAFAAKRWWGGGYVY